MKVSTEQEIAELRAVVQQLQLRMDQPGAGRELVLESARYGPKCRVAADFASLTWFGRTFPIRRGVQRAVVETLWQLHQSAAELALDESTIAARAGASCDNFKLRKLFQAESGIVGWAIHRLGDGFRLAPPEQNPPIIPE